MENPVELLCRDLEDMIKAIRHDLEDPENDKPESLVIFITDFWPKYNAALIQKFISNSLNGNKNLILPLLRAVTTRIDEAKSKRN